MKEKKCKKRNKYNVEENYKKKKKERKCNEGKLEKKKTCRKKRNKHIKNLWKE